MDRREKSDIECNKFYGKFADMTGGIMVFWCARHGFAVGAHLIPSSEGRTDVFSVIYNRWSNPPSVILYDYACASALYNNYRAPWFFKNTLHITDTHHAAGHTKCSRATKMPYFRDNPQLRHIRDSYAESGNRVLNRIKRSVRYSGLENGMRLVLMQLCTHNLMRQRRIHGTLAANPTIPWDAQWVKICEQLYAGGEPNEQDSDQD